MGAVRRVVNAARVLLELRAVYCKTLNFTCPLFREFRDLGKFAKMTYREYSNGDLVYCISSSSVSKNAKIKGAKIISQL